MCYAPNTLNCGLCDVYWAVLLGALFFWWVPFLNVLTASTQRVRLILSCEVYFTL